MKPARIVVLVIAVAAGGIAALLAGRSPELPPAPAPAPQLEIADVLVAASDIAQGSKIAAKDLRWQAWPAAAAAGPNFVRKKDQPDAIKQNTGATTRVAFSAGEPIRELKLLNGSGSGYMAAILSPGMVAVSVEISAENGAGGFVLPNDHVDVILSRRDKAQEKLNGGVETHTGEIILRNVRVMAIDQTVEEKEGQRVVVGKTATLELTPEQATKLAVSRQMGTVSLALRSLADFNAKPKPVAVAEEKPRVVEAPRTVTRTINMWRGTTHQSLTCPPPPGACE